MNIRDPRIDWNRHRGRYYVVESPAGVVVYLTEAEFLRMTRVWDSNEKLYIVLAEPTSRKPEEETPGPSEPKSESTEQSGESKPSAPVTKPKTSPPPSWWKWAGKLMSDFLKQDRVTSPTKEGREEVKSPKGQHGKSDRSDSTIKFIGTLVLPTKGNFGRLFKTWAEKAAWLTGKPPLVNNVLEVHRSVTILVRILSRGNASGLIAYLKTSYIATLKYIAGQPLRSTHSLGCGVSLDRSGLPRWMPLTWRNWVRASDTNGIRFVLSVLYMYRALTPKVVNADFSTISAEPFVGDISEFSECVNELFTHMGIKRVPFDTLIPNPVPSTRGSPNSTMMVKSIWLDGLAWCQHAYITGQHYVDQWLNTVLRLAYPDAPCESATKLRYLPSWSHHSLSVLRPKLNRKDDPSWMVVYRRMLRAFVKDIPNGVDKVLPKFEYALGRLAWWGDSGGKTRIVALPDFWTQLCLKPVHEVLAAILKLFPQDATFDQIGKTEEFAKRGYKCIWSYDLKAATDLIPAQLYEPIMRLIIGEELTSLWVKLLTDRSYDEFRNSAKPNDVFSRCASHHHRYTRGQPMGAYSSWPSMALVHHCLVLFSAKRAGIKSWWSFRDYLVLGDDVVIANALVAEQYREVCASHGVTVTILKSYISSVGMFQFASLVFKNGVNLSPASLREEIQNVTPAQRAQSVYRLVRNWYPDDMSLMRFVRLMTPRTAWLIAQPSFKGGSAHPLILCIIRTLLTPASTLSGIAGSVEASLVGWIGSFDPTFNLRSYIATLGISDMHRLLHTLNTRPVLRAATAKLYTLYTKRLLNLSEEAKELVLPYLKTSANFPKLHVKDIEAMFSAGVGETLQAYHILFFHDLQRKYGRLNKAVTEWRRVVYDVSRYWEDTDPTLQLKAFVELIRSVEHAENITFSAPWADGTDSSRPTLYSRKSYESWVHPGNQALSKLDEFGVNLNALCFDEPQVSAPFDLSLERLSTHWF